MKTAAELAMEKVPYEPILPPPPAPKTCLNCQWMPQQDEGYSNWTVMGYGAECIFNLNAFNSEDKDHDKKNAFAMECEFFTEGYKLELDIDDEDDQHAKAIRDWIKLVCK